MTTLIKSREMRGAFFGKQAIQDMFIARVEEHERQDQMLQGYGYWKDGKGCSVGCSYHSGDHFASEREANIPVQITFLQDGIFERLPVAEARK